MGREKQFEKVVKRFLETEGIYRIGTPPEAMTTEPCGYWVKRWGGGKYIPDGLPDLQICICGLSLDVELKAPSGKPSPLQLQKVQQILDTGAMAVVIWPSDLDDFKVLIKRIKRRYGGRNYAAELFPTGWL